MMKKVHLLFVALISFTSLLFGQIEVTNYGDIPENRLAISRWQNIKWDGSGTWQTIDVTTKGIEPNKTYDIAPLVNNIITSGSGKRIIKFPAGKYNIKSRLNINRDDIQIVGVGTATKFLLKGGNNPGEIVSNGGRDDFYNLAKDAKRGDNTISLTSSSGLSVGGYFIITQPGSATRPGASGDETQIFKITGKSGNVLTLDMKFGIPFKKATSKCQKLRPRKNLRFHNFYMEMLTKPEGGKSHNLSLNTVQNVEISNIESNKVLNSHVTVFRGREVICHDNYLHGNYGGGGGFQYGFGFNFSTNCQISNNVTADLRHHYATQFGSNHCVVAYNRALPPYNSYGDYGQHNSKGCHNNLWEGNYGKEIYDDANPLKSWGTRYTMWYRNHATSKVGSENAYVENMNIIGNELKPGTGGIKKGSPGENTYSGANIANINKEGGTGNMIWGDISPNAALPPSLFLKEKPSYLSRWPLYGPKATVVVVPDAIGPEDYTYITDENGTVEITDTPYDIAYGQDGNYLFKTNRTNDVSCTNATFGNDPIPGTKKYCFIRESKMPYSGTPMSIPGTLEAEYYDFGGEDRSYKDVDADNNGSLVFRNESGVDIDDLPNGIGYAIGWIRKGEWLEYTVDIAKPGQYDMKITYSSKSGGGSLGLDIDGSEMITDIFIPSTEDWNSYDDLTETVSLTAGVHVIRVNMEEAGFNLDKLEFTEATVTNTSEILSISSLQVFPNPSIDGVFNMNSSQDFEVFDIRGNKLLEGKSKTINLSNSSENIHLLHVGSRWIKLIK